MNLTNHTNLRFALLLTVNYKSEIRVLKIFVLFVFKKYNSCSKKLFVFKKIIIRVQNNLFVFKIQN